MPDEVMEVLQTSDQSILSFYRWIGERQQTCRTGAYGAVTTRSISRASSAMSFSLFFSFFLLTLNPYLGVCDVLSGGLSMSENSDVRSS